MKNLIQSVSKKQFNNFLKDKKTENLELINVIEKFFIKKRGYVIKKQKKGSRVVLLLSGGLDSIVAWAFLMDFYGYIVYPVVIRDKKNNFFSAELRSIKYFSKYFSKKYAGKYVDPYFLTASTYPKERSNFINKRNLKTTDILNNYGVNSHFLKNDSNVVVFSPQNIDPYLKSFYGLIYSQYLNFAANLGISDIFIGINSSDGLLASSQSLTSIRSAMLSMCTSSGSYIWNFSSPFFERETGAFLDKSAVISLGFQLGVPLEKTWSCYKKKGFFQCGNSCISCVNRKYSFEKAGIEDKTIYISSLKSRLIGALKFRFRKIFNFL